MTGFNTQTCRAENSYRLQFETDNWEYFLFMQEAARACVDGKLPDVIDRQKLIERVFPMGIPRTREDWNYAINARAVYEAINKAE